MRYEIRSRGVEVTDRLRAHVAERLRHALAHFGGQPPEVRVYLRDVNGPRGGLDKQCRVVVEMPRYGRVVLTGTDTDVYAAVTSTVSRARFAVRQRVKRRLARRRRRRQPGRRVPTAVPGGRIRRETEEAIRRQRKPRRDEARAGPARPTEGPSG